MEEALRRVSLLLQKKRSRNVLLVSLLLVLVASNAVVFSSRHIFTAQAAPSPPSSTVGSYYPPVAADREQGAQLAARLAREKHRAPLLTVPIRENTLGEGEGKTSLKESVRKSLARHSREKQRIHEPGVEGGEVLVGSAVDHVKLLGIDRVRKISKVKTGGEDSSFGDMLKTGLNTFNTIQALSQGLGGAKGGREANPIMNLVGSLLLPQGEGKSGGGGAGGVLAALIKGASGSQGGKGHQNGLNLDPIVDSAFNLLGGEETTGGIKRFAKPLINNFLKGNK